MPYFESREHLANFIRKAVRSTNTLTENDVFPLDFYIDTLVDRRLADEFGWQLRQDITLLRKSNFLQWIQQNTAIDIFEQSTANIYGFTQEFLIMMNSLAGVAGVYSFWLDRKTLLYVGMSVNLGQRIPSSYVEHLKKIGDPVYLRYIATENVADAAVMETFLISKLKPTLNRACKYSCFPSIKIQIPKMSKPFLCNSPVESPVEEDTCNGERNEGKQEEA